MGFDRRAVTRYREPVRLKFHTVSDGLLCVAAPFGPNRDHEILKYNRLVFEHFGLPINYIEAKFPRVSHGHVLEQFVRNHLDRVDYFVFFENDSIPLRGDVLQIAHDKIKDKRTLFGSVQTSNHKSPGHTYVGPNFLCFSKKLYLELGRPTLDDRLPNSDTAEFLSWEAERLGFNLCFINPTHCHGLTEEEQKRSRRPQFWRLGNGQKFGLGTTYGDLIFHASMQDLPRSKELFIEKCRSVIKG